VVRAETAKNKKREVVPLIPDVVEALRKHRGESATGLGLVFPNGIPRASRLRADSEKNGIQYQDEHGRFADFHALRYTFATFLQRHGVSLRFAVKLMRHSDVKLTAKHYADVSFCG
jgi:integrase